MVPAPIANTSLPHPAPKPCDAWTFYHVPSGHYSPAACGTWTCPICAADNADRWARLAAGAHPQRGLTLTKLPDRSDELRECIKAIVKAVRREYGPDSMEYFGIIELTPRRRLLHAHLLQRGAYIPQRWLSTHAHACGAGPVVDIRALKDEAAAALYAAGHLTRSVKSHWHDLPKGFRRIRYSQAYFPPGALVADRRNRRRSPDAPPSDYLLIRKPLEAATNAVERARAYWLQLGFGEPTSADLANLISRRVGLCATDG